MPINIGREKPGEILQIAMLTLAMTGGGFLLLFLMLSLVLIPSVQEDVAAAKDDYSSLTTQLQSAVAKDLRSGARRKKETGDDRQSLGEIVDQKLKVFGVSEDRRRAGGRGDRTELTLTTLHAPLNQLLSFVTSVREAKKTVQVQNVKIRRKARSRSQEGPEDAWTLEVVFLDYDKKS